MNAIKLFVIMPTVPFSSNTKISGTETSIRVLYLDCAPLPLHFSKLIVHRYNWKNGSRTYVDSFGTSIIWGSLRSSVSIDPSSSTIFTATDLICRQSNRLAKIPKETIVVCKKINQNSPEIEVDIVRVGEELNSSGNSIEPGEGKP